MLNFKVEKSDKIENEVIILRSNESIEKQKKTVHKKADNKLQDKKKLINKIQEESREKLIPSLRQKIDETSNYIINLLKEKGEENVNSIQIMSVIAQKSLFEIANAGNITYTPQEVMIGFNLYLEMINKINEIKTFPPTVESFAVFMGISRTTYNCWLVDPNKKEVMDYIHSYLLGMLATSSLTGELKEISSMFLQKTMGKIEAQAPMVIEHKKTTDIDEINAQLSALKGRKIIEGEIEEDE